MIVSASRRTDIPRWHTDWFFHRLKEGYALSRNPMNAKQVRRVGLSPEAVDCFVFWSKDPKPMTAKLAELDGYAYYFQFTLNAYGADIEPGLAPWDERMETFCRLAERIGPERVVWRYDPVLLNESYTADWHLGQFGKSVQALRGYTERCMFSFLDWYRKVEKPLRELGAEQPGMEQKLELAARMARVAGEGGVRLEACCEQGLEAAGVAPARCIDAELIGRITGKPSMAKKDRSQRPGCGCVQSVDIGVYDTCPMGCRYCYANRGKVKGVFERAPEREEL